MRLLPWMSRLATLLSFVAFVNPLGAEDKNYLVVFAAQAEGEAQFAHVFASFVRIPEAPGARAELCTISWLPKSMEVVVNRWQPEPGKNYDLRTTLEWAKRRGAQVTYCGPTMIQKELFDKARAQEKKLADGKPAFTARSAGFRPQEAIDCIHAVADVDCREDMLEVTETMGRAAVHLVARHFSKWMIEPRRMHAEILNHLGAQGFELWPAETPASALTALTQFR